MALGAVMEQAVQLTPQPGGVLPEIHLKEKTRLMRIRLLVPYAGVITDYIFKPCAIRATLPDGSAFFAISGCLQENRRICARLYEKDVLAMTRVPGQYKCALTIVNTTDVINRENYMDYDILTVLPFTVIVEPRAKEG